jgi:two-component system, chemotaxis family, chemotaxis protein CheY
MINADEKLVQDYLADCHDNLAAMETELLAMKMSEARINDERLSLVLQAAHAIGGPAPYFDLLKIRELAHQTENSAALIRFSGLAPTEEQIRVLLSATEKLGELIRNPGSSNQADTTKVTADLMKLRADHPTHAKKPSGQDGGAGRTSGTGGTSSPSNPDTRLLRILLVEDDFACRFLLQTFLARYGECYVAVNGREAVDVFRSTVALGLPWQPFDLICMDIMMPEMDGREAVRQIRAIEEAQGIQSTFGAKIFMTTTVQQVREVFESFKELSDAYLMKPIDLGQLVSQMKFYQLLE